MRKVYSFFLFVFGVAFFSTFVCTFVLPSWVTLLVSVGVWIAFLGCLALLAFFSENKIIVRIIRRKPRRFQLTADQSSAAAKAWAEKLCPPVPANYFGEGTPPWAIRTLAEPLRASATPQQGDAFQKALLLHLLDGLDHCYIGCGYSPDHVLSGALRAAAICCDISPLPETSCMTFHDGGVQVSWGYQQEFEELLPRSDVVSLS